MAEHFLDQSIIVGYAGFIFNEQETIIRTIEKFGRLCTEFIEHNKEEDFITCFYIAEKDLPKFKVRRRIILEEIKKKIQNPGYELGSSEIAIKHLYKRDINKAGRIFSLLRIISEKELTSLYQILLEKVLKRIL